MPLPFDRLEKKKPRDLAEVRRFGRTGWKRAELLEKKVSLGADGAPLSGFLDPSLAAGADEEGPGAGSVKTEIRRDGPRCGFGSTENFSDSVVGLAARP